MARRRSPVADAADPANVVPQELRGRTYLSNPVEIARWVRPDERAPAGYDFGEWLWRVFTASERKRAARKAWCVEHGLDYDVVFLHRRPGSPLPGRVGVAALPRPSIDEEASA